MAQLRLSGEVDRTTEFDLITDDTLASLGISRDEVKEAVFSHMVAVTEDLVRSGVPSAAAEFPEMARDYASSTRLKNVSSKLNRKALRVAADQTEKRAHRLRLLATSPALYWELFGSTCS